MHQFGSIYLDPVCLFSAVEDIFRQSWGQRRTLFTALSCTASINMHLDAFERSNLTGAVRRWSTPATSSAPKAPFQGDQKVNG